MSNKTPFRVLLLAALAAYFSIPLARKVKSGEPIDLADASPALVSWLLALITGMRGEKRSPAASDSRSNP
jgi:hypothetical protein